MRKVVVIGGGISGLAVAQELIDLLPEVDVCVLEAGRRLGGVIATHHREGFLCEAGPHGFMNRDASTIALARRLGLDRELLVANESHRGRYVLTQGRLRRFPSDFRSFVASDLLSLRARLRLLAEPFLPMPAGTADLAVGPFMRERLGAEATALLIDPLLTGFFGGDLERLSLAATLPHIQAARAQGESVVNSFRRHLSRTKSLVGGLPAGRLVSFTRGIESIIQALAQSLGARVYTDSPAVRLRQRGSGWEIHVGGAHPVALEADVVVSAAPAAAAARYLSEIDLGLALGLSRLRSAPAAVVSLGYRAQDVMGLPGFGYLTPTSARTRILGVLNSSRIFPHRAPLGMWLVEAILGGCRDETVHSRDDAALVADLTAQLRAVARVAAAPVFARVERHPAALPQYDVGHLEHVEALSRRLALFPGLFLSGHSLRGVGINACTREAARTAKQAAAYLTALAPVLRRRRSATRAPAWVNP